MGESEGQQSAGIQYCTSIRTELGERGKERKSWKEGEVLKKKRLKAKEIEKQKEAEGRAGQRTRGTKRKVEREIEKEIDGRRNIHEGTHKRRQTETLQLHDHVFSETMRNRKGRFGWKGPVGQNRETSMSVWRNVCICVHISSSCCGLYNTALDPQEIFTEEHRIWAMCSMMCLTI